MSMRWGIRAACNIGCMHKEALAAARELVPVIRLLRDDTESQRRLAATVVTALRAARLCRMSLPVEVGGLAVPPAEALAIYELLAGAEASVSWIVWNSALPSYYARYLAPDAREEIFANHDGM